MSYDFKKSEEKWAKFWVDNKVYATDVWDFNKPKYYILDMFPYPSGSGLHVGHAEGYTASDILARMKRMQGYNVLHPIGWDAFGLPAEQYALKTNHHPKDFNKENIANFRRQIKRLGFSYDWDREIDTTDPQYYHWTQWMFTKLVENNLAYVDSIPVNFCPELGTVLANEEVIDGKSEVGGFEVIRLPMRQWVVGISTYAEQLLENLDQLNWPMSTIDMQRNWIGKSIGTQIVFRVQNQDLTFEVFTTRVDTLYGCTYCCLAPEHPLLSKIVSSEQQAAVQTYQKATSHKSDLERQQLKEKSGVFSGAYAINPINDEVIPIYVADYVIYSYGSGAVMAVPAHDERDFEFAKKFHLPIKVVLENDKINGAFIDDAPHINSPLINGLNIAQSKEVLNTKLHALGAGSAVTKYKLRDWLFSRQRYWGEPIPVVHLDDGELYILKDQELPLELPYLAEFKPSGTGESPLALAKTWVNVEIDGVPGKRETNTMPQWAGSCWYYLRYLDPNNTQAIADPMLIKHWMPVDLYIGGAEHAVLHLLYARFWYKVLEKLGVVFDGEPFKRLFHQGTILGENGEKMSKSRGNVVNPDTVCDAYGADALRLYEMFMGPLEDAKPWSNNGLEGARRYLDRVYRLFDDPEYQKRLSNNNDGKLDYVYNYSVKKVTEDFENLQFNTAISQLMILTNEFYKAEHIYRPYLLGLVKLIYPICPFIGEELWSMLSDEPTISYVAWPTYEASKIVKQTETIAFQVNGKLRSSGEFPLDISQEELIKEALNDEKIEKFIAGLRIVKTIVVPHRIVNIVVEVKNNEKTNHAS